MSFFAAASTAVVLGPDEIVFRALNLAGTDPILDSLMILFSLASTAYVFALLAVPLWWRGRREAAFDLLVLLGITIVVTEALKFAIGRPRPCDTLANVRYIAGFGCDVEFDPSFPSGHASRAFAVAAFLGLRYRWRLGPAAITFAILAGLSRIYLGVHWPSDLLGGAAVGVGMALLIELAHRRIAFYQTVRERVVDAIPHRRSKPEPPA